MRPRVAPSDWLVVKLLGIAVTDLQAEPETGTRQVQSRMGISFTTTSHFVTITKRHSYILVLKHQSIGHEYLRSYYMPIQ